LEKEWKVKETTFIDIFDANSRKIADDRQSFREMYWVDKDELVKMTNSYIAIREGEAVARAIAVATSKLNSEHKQSSWWRKRKIVEISEEND
jgi:hypothetical protein